MKKIFLVLTILTLAFLIACSSSDDSTPPEESFNVPMLLADATNNIILPTLQNFNTQANTFESTVASYLNDPKEQNFTAMRDQWIETATSYERTYVFHIGRARDLFLHQAIYNWPTVASSLEDFVANSEVTAENVAAISPQIKALAGIEYLLFKGDVATTNQEFVDNTKRQDYLKYASAYLTSQADRLLGIWSQDGENYAAKFIANEDSGINDSFNLFLNGLNNAIDTGKVTKIGKPAGLESSDVVNPEIVQAPYSDQSLQLLLESIETVEEAFFGDNSTNVSDYIFFVIKNNDLNDDLQTKINEVKAAITAIPVPLEEAVESNPTEVMALHDRLNELGILISVDVRSVLSIIITSTDNDGD